MPTRKKKNNVSTGAGRSDLGGKGERNGIHWLNHRITDEDAQYLEQQDVTLEQLAARVLSMADDGYGFSIRRTSDGSSLCASIIRSFGDSDGSSVGLSAFGDNVRDTCLALLYKLDHYVGGELRSEHISGENIRSRFR